MDNSKKYENPSPEIKASFLSKLLYCWILPFFRYGFKHDLEVKDLYNTTKHDLAGPLGEKLEKNWNAEITKSRKDGGKPSLLRAMSKTFFKSYILFGIELLFGSCVIQIAQALFLAKYIKYFDREEEMSETSGWLLATGVITMASLVVLMFHQTSLGQQRIGMRCRVACSSLVYRKLLRLSKTSVGQTASGQVINLLSNDVGRFDLTPLFLHYIWIMPIQATVSAIVMYRSIGPSALVGLLALAVQAIPLQGYLAHWQAKLRYKIAKRTDTRVQLTNEITSGIQVIKMYAWEKPFQKLVEIARKLELDLIDTTSYIRGFSVSLMVFTERFTLFLTVVSYALMGNILTSDKVFSIAQLFNSVQLYMAIFFPLGISYFAEALISVRRLEDFLVQEEIGEPIEMIVDMEQDKRGTVKVMNGKASWLKNAIIDTLTNINLDVQQGNLCAVVGAVGVGKSSLLQLLLKELPLHGGKLQIEGSVAYASQDPWLFASSVRNNILFGRPYKRQRYQKVVQVCALERDFELLPHGDKTLVGDRGVSLSGGQRARINLARAVYQQADIYLLDDPLSAVDTHVAKHLFDECISKFLDGKTRILVTHQIQFLKFVDKIVVMNNGQIERVCTYRELRKSELAHLQHETSVDESEQKAQKTPDTNERVRLISMTSHTSESSFDVDENEPQETQEMIGKGSIPTSLYVEYFRSGAGIGLGLLVIFALLLAQAATNGFDLYLTHWTKSEEAYYKSLITIETDPVTEMIDENSTFTTDYESTTEIATSTMTLEDTTFITFNATNVPEDQYSQNYHIHIATALVVTAIIVTTLRSFIFLQICIKCSRVLHNNMFKGILSTTMRFFDTNPSGRILNRFSKDLGLVDEIMPRTMLEAIQIFLVMGGIFFMVFLVTPWMLIVVVILAVPFFTIRLIYLASAQDIKRLEAITKAPVLSHISSSLNGITTIRSSKAQEIVLREFDVLQDQHTSAFFQFLAVSEAFGFYLDVISLIFLIILSFQFLIFDDGTTISAHVGLVISQSLILTGMLQFGIRQSAEVANQMTCVERILQYTKLENEGQYESSPTRKPLREWPQRGKITFSEVSLRYIPDDPPVLLNLNFTINAGEKVGVVGRTGAGKSSLIAALFRLAPTEGSIIIDGINTKTIGLHDLRSKISIIPQVPVLFTETIRHNLDPFEKCDDKTLWDALESVELREAIDSLDQSVTEGGSNFSVGQRQLLCLARAIVRNNKILIMDEATANVDNQTDSLIQNTIRKNFKDCTVITIAHRLNTIADTDRVLVMDAGQMVEFDHPHELLQNPDGKFTGMVKEAGSSTENSLRQIALDAYNKVPLSAEQREQMKRDP